MYMYVCVCIYIYCNAIKNEISFTLSIIISQNINIIKHVNIYIYKIFKIIQNMVSIKLFDLRKIVGMSSW